MQTLYSVLFLVALAGAVVLSVRRPFAGLLVVAAASPFYSLLRESSVGSPVFFLWPYVLVGVLVGVLVAREVAALRAARGLPRLGPNVAKIVLFLLLLMAGVVEADTRLIRTLVTDASLSEIGSVLSTTSFLVLSLVLCAMLAALFVWFPSIMRRLEGRVSIVDVAVSAFLLAGLVGIVVTYARNGLIFTGLNGFRYYFALGITYLPARYFMRTRRQEALFLRVLGLVCLAGAAQLLLESFLLNQLRVPFEQLPWVGPLAREFGYQPEPRSFFDAPFMPIGFMYMTHVSGLFLLLGFAIAAPVLLARGSRIRDHRLELAVAAAAIVGGIWTSRTVLLLLAASFLLAAVLVPSTWRRRLAGVVVICALSAVTARWLIPGARYDLRQELTFLAGRAVPNLVDAILVDAGEVFGLGRTAAPAPPTEVLPAGWSLPAAATFQRQEAGRGRYVLSIASVDSADLRTRLPEDLVKKGEPIRAEAFIRYSPGTRPGLQLFDADGVLTEVTARGGVEGGETLVATAIARGTVIAFDIDVPAGGRVTLERVLFTGPTGTLAALGFDPPQWSPHGWHVMDRESSSELVASIAEGPVRLTAGAEGLDFRYFVPGAVTARGVSLTVAADIEAPKGQRFGLQYVLGDRVVDEVHGEGTGAPVALEVSGRARGGQVTIDIDLPPHGTAIVHDVRARIGAATASLLKQPLMIEPLRSAAPPLAGAPEPAPPPRVVEAPPVTPPVAPPVTPPVSLSLPPPPAAPVQSEPSQPVFATQTSETFKAVLLGHGAEFGTWNQVFYAAQTDGEFAVSSYSDAKYLEFFQQFGALGLGALLFVGIAPLWPAMRLWQRAETSLDRARIVGLVLMLFVTFVSLLHLPSLFKVGFGTAVFIAMAMIPRLETERAET